jgi:dienelactone hydrolase
VKHTERSANQHEADQKPTRTEFLRAASLLGASGALSAGAVQARGSAQANGAAQSPGSPQPAPPAARPADLGTRLADVEALAAKNEYRLSFLGSRFSSFSAFEKEARASIFDALRYQPEPVDPAMEVLETVDCGSYLRKRITFRTTPLFRVPAYLLVPKNLSGRAPGIVDLHSHGGMFLYGKEKVVDLADGGGANHPAMTIYHRGNYESRPTATALVKRGYVVVSIDAFGFGERRIVLDRDLPAALDRDKLSVEETTRLNRVCASKESTLVKALTLAGATWPGVVFWDDIRTVDLLASLPEVDAARIGCAGVSMGGYRSLFLAALEPRIRAACVAGFMSTVKPMIRAHVDTHSFIHFLPELHRNLDWPDVASLTAPRALMVLQCSRDGLFPLTGMQDAVRHIGAAYKKAGVADQFHGRFYDQPHIFSVAMQEDAFAWFDRHLKS